MKRCTNCKRSLPDERFNADPRMKSGLQSWCKGCKAAYKRAQNSYRGKAPEGIRVMPTYGETRRNAKLTNDDVRLIRGLFLDLSCAEIARKFEVSRSCISRIKNGYSWYRVF